MQLSTSPLPQYAVSPLLDRHQSAAFLSVSIRTLDEKIARKEIPVVRIGKSVRLRIETLERFIEANESPVKASGRE